MTDHLPAAAASSAVAVRRELLSLSGSALLNRILEDDRPAALIRSLPGEDFFWIVKRIGEEESAAVLDLAGEEQWEYLLDLEVWDRDRIDADKVLTWLKRLHEADPERLSAWLLAREHTLVSLLLLRTAEVVIKEGDEEANHPEGYFTLEGRFYIRALKTDHRETLEALLRILARRDHLTYQSLLYKLAAILPAEAEEELYRLRSGRIAENGFLPYEEALTVYAPLEPAALPAGEPPPLPGGITLTEAGALIPLSPLLQVESGNLASLALSRIDDPLQQDRIRLELAGLCNRIIAAGAFSEVADARLLAATGRRAGGYLNIALERLGGSPQGAAELLRHHSLETLFRVGYGFAVKLQREAQRWRRESWFAVRGLHNDFWGSPWSETLEGLLAVRPLFFAAGNKEPHRDFLSVADIEETRRRFSQVRALDCLLARLSTDPSGSAFPSGRTFHPLLFNRWARRILQEPPLPAPLTPAEARRFFGVVRRGETGPPYRMGRFGEGFVAAFLEGPADFDPETAAALGEALQMTWDAFREEYEGVAKNDLESRYSRFLLIAPAERP